MFRRGLNYYQIAGEVLLWLISSAIIVATICYNRCVP